MVSLKDVKIKADYYEMMKLLFVMTESLCSGEHSSQNMDIIELLKQFQLKVHMNCTRLHRFFISTFSSVNFQPFLTSSLSQTVSVNLKSSNMLVKKKKKINIQGFLRLTREKMKTMMCNHKGK